MTLLRASLATLALAIASPALADAVTYQGTLGKLPVVVELSIGVEEATETVVGRYFYPSKGIDIPLDAVTVEPGKLELSEEIPCTAEICEQSFADQIFPEAVRGASWSIKSTDDGETITGTWQNTAGKPLAIALTRVASREIELTDPVTPQSLSLLTYNYTNGQQQLTMENAPYDYLRTDVELKWEPDTVWGDVAFTYGVDSRTRFRYPRITRLGGADFSLANHRLADEQALMTIDALGCEALQYYGMGWYPSVEYSAGTLGGYPDETLDVAYLTPTLMTWTEGGSLFCGGAYPENHFTYRTMDVRTGKNLDFGKIFADWGPHDFVTGEPADAALAAANPVDYSWGPGEKLIALAKSKREDSGDAEYEESCGFDDLISEYLSVSFRQGDIAVFSITSLPHVIGACEQEIFAAPIADLREYLAPTAAEYFPSLAD